MAHGYESRIAGSDSKFLLTSPSPAFETVNAGTQVDLLKKATCNTVTIENNRLYLVMGASGTEIIVDRSFRSVFVLFDLLQLPGFSSY